MTDLEAASPQTPQIGPICLGKLVGLRGPSHAHCLILGAFHLPCFRCGPQASEITKPPPQASARGGGVANSTPFAQRHRVLGFPPHPPTPGNPAKPSPCLQCTRPPLGRGLAEEAK